jgi:hypothetical protein
MMMTARESVAPAFCRLSREPALNLSKRRLALGGGQALVDSAQSCVTFFLLSS